jgi:hypothetical protein
MRFVDYAQQAASTAIYPEHLRVIYPTLGLAGEAGELVALLDRAADGGVVETDLVLGEIGDVAWYVAALASDLEVAAGLHLPEIGVGLPARPAALPVEVGIVAEQVKKAHRDHGGELPEERRVRVVAALQQVLLLLASAAETAGSTLPDVLDANLAKLASRQRRGALGGDGDRR